MTKWNEKLVKKGCTVQDRLAVLSPLDLFCCGLFFLASLIKVIHKYRKLFGMFQLLETTTSIIIKFINNIWVIMMRFMRMLTMLLRILQQLTNFQTIFMNLKIILTNYS